LDGQVNWTCKAEQTRVINQNDKISWNIQIIEAVIHCGCYLIPCSHLFTWVNIHMYLIVNFKDIPWCKDIYFKIYSESY
jgi:hypothetical protein